MVSDCTEYEKKGYCLIGRQCPFKHGKDLIELDVSGYQGLIEAIHKSSIKATAICKEQQNELKRKQTDLLNNLISQQRALIKKIEQCSDENEKLRLKTALDEMSQKTKDWIEQEGARSKNALNNMDTTAKQTKIVSLDNDNIMTNNTTNTTTTIAK